MQALCRSTGSLQLSSQIPLVSKIKTPGMFPTDGKAQLNHIRITGVERREVKSLRWCWHRAKMWFCSACCKDASEAQAGLLESFQQSRDLQNSQQARG